MNWKLIAAAIGVVFATGIVLYTQCVSGDPGLNARMNRKISDKPVEAGAAPSATAKAPAIAAPAPNPNIVAPQVAPVAPAVTQAVSGGTISAPSIVTLAPPPPRQRGQVSAEPTERVRHTLLRLARIQMALDDYARAHEGRFPATAIYAADGKTPLLSWRVAILPYLGYVQLYQRFKLYEPWNSPHNQALLAEIPLYYQSPDRGDERTNYLGGMVLQHAQGMRREDIQDGAENTLLLVEADDTAAISWTEPRDFPRTGNPREQLGKLRGGGFFAVWCSGLVSLIPGRVSPPQIMSAFTPSMEDGENYLNLSEPVGPKVVSIASVTPVPAPRPDDPDGPTPPGVPATNVAATTRLPTPAVAPAAPPSLQSIPAITSLLRSAIQRGQEPRAMQVAHAAAALDSDPKGFSSRVAWSPGLKRPALAIRWGIGIDLPAQVSAVPTIPPHPRIRITPKKMHSVLTQATGELGARVVDYLETAIADGQFGSLLQECATGPALPAASNIQFAPPDNTHINDYFHPGIAYLGRANTKQLMSWAQQDAIDVLLVFSIECKSARGNINYSETSIAIHDVARGIELYSTPSPINSRKVQIDRANEKEERDPVAAYLEKPLEFIGQQLRLDSFPQSFSSQPALIRSRVDTLLASEPRDRLATLAELRAYQVRGWLDPATFKSACQKLLDDDAADKLAGDVSLEERLKAMNRWLPKMRVGPAVAAPAANED